MPLWVASLVGGLIQIAGTLVGKVLLSLGIGYVTFSGVDTTLTFAREAFIDGVAGLPADAIAMAGLLKVGVCASMLLSALTARLTLAGLTSGTLKRFAMRS
jgi:hypothetical protein